MGCVDARLGYGIDRHIDAGSDQGHEFLGEGIGQGHLAVGHLLGHPNQMHREHQRIEGQVFGDLDDPGPVGTPLSLDVMEGGEGATDLEGIGSATEVVEDLDRQTVDPAVRLQPAAESRPASPGGFQFSESEPDPVQIEKGEEPKAIGATHGGVATDEPVG